MAIAGLQNLSVFDSSLLRENQSSTARQIDDRVRPSSRASSIRQMWRELDDEHVVSHAQNEAGERLGQRTELLRSREEMSDDGGETRHHSGDVDTWCEGQAGSGNDNEDISDLDSEHSSDFGEVERRRVRQIFREWMDCGAKETSSSVVHVNRSSRGEWLGETEQERVRIIRGWVQMNTQQRGSNGDQREEQAAEMGGQIEQVLDGLVVNPNEGRTEFPRRGIRKLCGRQALLDMLKKVEKERQTELEGLMERRAVSRFAHRNRIQALLRGRFLRHDRVVRDERPASIAASELGLLRQRHTVSGLREGFFSKLDSVSGQVRNDLSDTASNTNNDGMTNDLSRVNSSDPAGDEFNYAESLDAGVDSSEVPTHRNVVGDTFENTNIEESNNDEDWQEQLLENQVVEWQHSERVGRIMQERNGWLQGINNVRSMDNSESGSQDQGLQLDACDIGIQSEACSNESTIHRLLDHSTNPDHQRRENIASEGSAVELEQLQEQDLSREGRDRQQTDIGFNEFRGDSDDTNEVDVESHHPSTAEYQELIESGIREDDHFQEGSAVWGEDYGFQGMEHSWSERPSDQEAMSSRRVDMFYLPDDDNVNNIELRELLSRRSVSNLLGSSFRESLDQLIQSYVERQGHDGSLDLDLSPQAEQDPEQQNRGLDGNQGVAIRSPLRSLPSAQVPRPHPVWDQESTHDNWDQHEMHQRFGIDWETVNDLRIDMARIQHRMNNMQSMLEACMDMQLELQRSIRQEVSAALNRTAGSSGECEINLPNDGSQWDHVRKGICCICCESSIDSLLYRCGHMCTCRGCAAKLVQGGGKCPMCRAPVVEVIRAYSIL